MRRGYSRCLRRLWYVRLNTNGADGRAEISMRARPQTAALLACVHERGCVVALHDRSALSTSVHARRFQPPSPDPSPRHRQRDPQSHAFGGQLHSCRRLPLAASPFACYRSLVQMRGVLLCTPDSGSPTTRSDQPPPSHCLHKVYSPKSRRHAERDMNSMSYTQVKTLEPGVDDDHEELVGSSRRSADEHVPHAYFKSSVSLHTAISVAAGTVCYFPNAK
jgi:hypothetical protein